MFNLLTEHAKRGAMREYRARLITVLCVFVGAELLLAASGGVFSFVALREEGKRLASELEVLHSTRALTEETVMIEEVKKTKARLGFLVSPHPIQVAEAVSAFASLRTAGIHLVAINVILNAEIEWTISVSGVAATRDALAEFESAVKADRRFADSDFPLGSFAKEKDIAFNISAMYLGDSI